MGSSVVAVASEKYTPAAKSKRDGIGLCLSGGGYRATLFHLGSLRRLNELGVLTQVKTISCVSGGSIMAAHLASAVQWPLQGPMTFWENRVAATLRAFTSKNIRTGAILKRLLPWNWFDTSTGVDALEARYAKDLISLKLGELPEKPNFVFCATDMVFGVNWVFEKDRTGDYQAGYLTPHPANWPVARAVAASSCFPPVFNPLPVQAQTSQFKDGRASQRPNFPKCISDLRLTDGGVYDNLGLEPVWKDHSIVLCSDGGGTFDFQADKDLFWRIQRYVSIVENQAGALRKRWLIANFINREMEGAYWGIGSATASYGTGIAAGYSKDLAEGVIAEIRTDLDSFSEAEAAVLENHGYLLANAAIERHLSSLRPFPAPPVDIPHPEWMDENKVRVALRNSSKRKILGRF